MRTRTSPAQNISPGHHAWTGGSGCWLGNVASAAAEGLATTVETDTADTVNDATVVTATGALNVELALALAGEVAVEVALGVKVAA